MQIKMPMNEREKTTFLLSKEKLRRTSYSTSIDQLVMQTILSLILDFSLLNQSTAISGFLPFNLLLILANTKILRINDNYFILWPNLRYNWAVKPQDRRAVEDKSNFKRIEIPSLWNILSFTVKPSYNSANNFLVPLNKVKQPNVGNCRVHLPAETNDGLLQSCGTFGTEAGKKKEKRDGRGKESKFGRGAQVSRESLIRWEQGGPISPKSHKTIRKLAK